MPLRELVPRPVTRRHQIAFASNRDGDSMVDYDIYVMDSDGSNVRQLTDDPGWDSSPNWSPDVSMIAFYSDRDGDSMSEVDIYVMDADGSNVRG